MSEIEVDSADSATASDDETASSAEEDGLEVKETEDGEQPAEEEDPTVILTRNTQRRFDTLTTTVKQQAATIEKMRQQAPMDDGDLVEPKPDDFDDDLEFARAAGAYDAQVAMTNKLNAERAERQQQNEAAAVQQQVQTYNQRVAETLKTTPDFREVVQNSGLQTQDQNGRLTPTAEAIMEAENGPAVAYHIASNPELVSNLNFATPTQAAMTVARLSIQLAESPAPVNNAPPPVGSEDTGAGPGNSDDGLNFIEGASFE